MAASKSSLLLKSVRAVHWTHVVASALEGCLQPSVQQIKILTVHKW